MRREIARHALLAAGSLKLRAAGNRPLAQAANLLRRSPEERAWVARIEAVRARMESSTQVLREEDGQTLGAVTRETAKQPPWSTFLHRAVRALRPASVLEMGTSVGVSGMYIAAALRENGRGRLLTLDGSAARAEVARANFAELGLDDLVEARVGWFTDTLDDALRDAAPVDLLFIDGHHQEEPTIAYFEQALPHLAPRATVLFDDIRWSDGMRRAWQVVQRHPKVTRAVDLRTIGVVEV